MPVAAFAVVSDGGDNPHVAAVTPTTNVSAETSTTEAPTSKAAIEVLRVVPADPSIGETVTFAGRATHANCGVTVTFGDEASVRLLACRAVCANDLLPTPTTTVDDKTYQHVYRAERNGPADHGPMTGVGS